VLDDRCGRRLVARVTARRDHRHDGGDGPAHGAPYHARGTVLSVHVVHGHANADWPAAAVAIGNFDGVHLGHRALIARAREIGPRAVALTFDPHPGAVLAPAGAPPALTSLARKLELLEDAGADAVIVEPFTRELAAMSADDFVDAVLCGGARAEAIVVGYDFRYGAGRAGTIDTLRAHAARCEIGVAVVDPVEVDGEVASSTKIRALLAGGDVAAASRLLGRRYDVDGVVVHGAERGRAIGVPTANVAPVGGPALARPGIYAVTLDGRPAVASLGTNPTFVTSSELVLEVHVLDFDGDLYEKTVRVAFVARLRDEAKFASVAALVEQIRHDIEAARAVL
jgi:riboflavin kinase/FMN adenylyltransferase